MKNLKRLLGLMAISGFAFGFAGNVNATGKNASTTCLMPGQSGSGNNCVATIGSDHYETFADALDDALAYENGATIQLVRSTTSGSIYTTGIDKKVTVNVGKYTLNLQGSYFNVAENGELTITGTKDGKITNSMTTLFMVEDGSLKVDGELKLDAAGTEDHGAIIVAKGDVTVNKANITGQTNKPVVDVAKQGITVTLNANVGDSKTIGAQKIIDVTAAAKTSDETAAKVIINGGKYYVGNTAFEVKNNVELTINNGTVNAGYRVIELREGKVTINNGTLKTDNRSAIVVKNTASDKSSLEIKGGTVATTDTDNASFALYLESKDAHYAISNGTFEGSKVGNAQTPAMYIEDNLLTGMVSGLSYPINTFANILTGGKYLGTIIGNAKIEYDDGDGAKTVQKSADDVVKYIVADNYKVIEEGNYKKIVPATTDGSEEQKPGSTTGDDTPGKNPQTYDGIMSYVTLAISSLGALGIATKKVLF